MKKHTIIEIEGNNHYYCKIDSMNRIIVVDPHNDFLHMKLLKDVFDMFKDRAMFTVFDTDIDPDLIVGEDIYNHMVKKNPSIGKLTEIFDLEISS